ncbi:Arginine decarboxylase [compost metagenome]
MKSIDLSKLCICVKDTGLSGFEVVNLLRSECKIQMELGDMYNILAVISLDDRTQDLDKLVKALKYIRENHSKDTKLNFDFKSLSIPKTLLNPRDAFFSDKKYVSLKDAVNKISGDTIIVYPPGIPIVSIGEEINKEIADYIEDMFNQGVEIIGMVDDTIAIIE